MRRAIALPPSLAKATPNKPTKQSTNLPPAPPPSVREGINELIEYQNGIYHGTTLPSGERHNLGIYAWDSGEVYFGEWRQDTLNGEGVIFYPQGAQASFLHGFFSKGRLSGAAFLKLSNGDIYEGFWRNGKLEGNCYKFFSEKDKWILSDYKNGEFSHVIAKGTGLPPSYVFGHITSTAALASNHAKNSLTPIQCVNFSDGGQYLGLIRKSMPSGLGLFIYSDEKYDVGIYKSGNLHGIGRKHLHTGDIYDGELKNGTFHGKGVFFQSSTGEWIYGTFENNKCIDVIRQGFDGVFPIEIALTLRAEAHLKATNHRDSATPLDVFSMPTYNNYSLFDADDKNKFYLDLSISSQPYNNQRMYTNESKERKKSGSKKPIDASFNSDKQQNIRKFSNRQSSNSGQNRGDASTGQRKNSTTKSVHSQSNQNNNINISGFLKSSNKKQQNRTSENQSDQSHFGAEQMQNIRDSILEKHRNIRALSNNNSSKLLKLRTNSNASNTTTTSAIFPNNLAKTKKKPNSTHNKALMNMPQQQKHAIMSLKKSQQVKYDTANVLRGILGQNKQKDPVFLNKSYSTNHMDGLTKYEITAVPNKTGSNNNSQTISPREGGGGGGRGRWENERQSAMMRGSDIFGDQQHQHSDSFTAIEYAVNQQRSQSEIILGSSKVVITSEFPVGNEAHIPVLNVPSLSPDVDKYFVDPLKYHRALRGSNDFLQNSRESSKFDSIIKQQQNNSGSKRVASSSADNSPKRSVARSSKKKQQSESHLDLESIRNEIASFEQIASQHIPERQRRPRTKRDTISHGDVSSLASRTPFSIVTPTNQEGVESVNPEEVEVAGADLQLEQSEFVLDSIKQIKQEMLSQLHELESKQNSLPSPSSLESDLKETFKNALRKPPSFHIPRDTQLTTLKDQSVENSPQKMAEFASFLQQESPEKGLSQNEEQLGEDNRHAEQSHQFIQSEVQQKYYTEDEVNLLAERIERNLTGESSYYKQFRDICTDLASTDEKQLPATQVLQQQQQTQLPSQRSSGSASTSPLRLQNALNEQNNIGQKQQLRPSELNPASLMDSTEVITHQSVLEGNNDTTMLSQHTQQQPVTFREHQLQSPIIHSAITTPQVQSTPIKSNNNSRQQTPEQRVQQSMQQQQKQYENTEEYNQQQMMNNMQSQSRSHISSPGDSHLTPPNQREENNNNNILDEVEELTEFASFTPQDRQQQYRQAREIQTAAEGNILLPDELYASQNQQRQLQQINQYNDASKEYFEEELDTRRSEFLPSSNTVASESRGSSFLTVQNQRAGGQQQQAAAGAEQIGEIITSNNTRQQYQQDYFADKKNSDAIEEDDKIVSDRTALNNYGNYEDQEQLEFTGTQSTLPQPPTVAPSPTAATQQQSTNNLNLRSLQDGSNSGTFSFVQSTNIIKTPTQSPNKSQRGVAATPPVQQQEGQREQTTDRTLVDSLNSAGVTQRQSSNQRSRNQTPPINQYNSSSVQQSAQSSSNTSPIKVIASPQRGINKSPQQQTAITNQVLNENVRRSPIPTSSKQSVAAHTSQQNDHSSLQQENTKIFSDIDDIFSKIREKVAENQHQQSQQQQQFQHLTKYTTSPFYHSATGSHSSQPNSQKPSPLRQQSPPKQQSINQSPFKSSSLPPAATTATTTNNPHLFASFGQQTPENNNQSLKARTTPSHPSSRVPASAILAINQPYISIEGASSNSTEKPAQSNTIQFQQSPIDRLSYHYRSGTPSSTTNLDPQQQQLLPITLRNRSQIAVSSPSPLPINARANHTHSASPSAFRIVTKTRTSYQKRVTVTHNAHVVKEVRYPSAMSACRSSSLTNSCIILRSPNINNISSSSCSLRLNLSQSSLTSSLATPTQSVMVPMLARTIASASCSPARVVLHSSHQQPIIAPSTTTTTTIAHSFVRSTTPTPVSVTQSPQLNRLHSSSHSIIQVASSSFSSQSPLPVRQTSLTPTHVSESAPRIPKSKTVKGGVTPTGGAAHSGAIDEREEGICTIF